MKNFLKYSLLAGLTVLACTGCKKDATPVKTANLATVKTVTSSPIPGYMVMTPRGLMAKSQVHLVEAGYHLEIRDNHALKVKDVTGELKEDFGVITPPASLSNGASNQTAQPNQPAAGSHNLALTTPNNVTGWVTYSEWEATATPIGTFSSTWAVPALPSTQDSQLVYIGDGIESAKYVLNATSPNLVIEPALQWGSNNVFGTSSTWTIANWCVWNGGAAYSTPITVTTGTSLQGVITLTSVTGGSYNYTSAFNGQTNTLNVTAGNSSNYSGVTIPTIPEESWAFESLQAYNFNTTSGHGVNDYPNQPSVNMKSINIQTGQPGSFIYPTTFAWSTNVTAAALYGEHTVIYNPGWQGAGEVDLWFHYGPPSITYGASNESYSTCGTITPLTPTNSGGTATSWSISPSLTTNTGMGFNTSTGVITGPATIASAPVLYTITATNNGGTSTFNITIGVTGATTISYPSTEVYNQNTVITPVSPTVSGTTPTGYTISPSNFSSLTGLTFNTTTGVISGTASVPCAPTNFTITASGACGGTATINIAVAFPFTFYNHITGSGTPPSSNWGSISVTFKYSSTSTQYGQGVVYEGNTTTFWLPPGNYNVVMNPAYYQYPTNCSFIFDGGNPPGPADYGVPGATFNNVPLSLTNTNDILVHN